jgi:tetratricopeptide (TPR) repeat protein
VRIDLYHALIPLGNSRRAKTLLDEAETLARSSGQPARRGWVAAYQTNVLWMLGESDRATESGERALAVAEKERDTALRVAGAFYLGQVHQFRGDYLRAARLLRTVAGVGDCEAYGLPGVAGVIGRAWLALSLAELGEFDEAVVLAQAALAMGDTADHAFSQANAYRAAGYVWILRGHPLRAAAVLERGMALCESRDVPLYLPIMSGALGCAYTLAGRYNEAVPLLERAAAVPVRSGHALRLAWLGEAYLRTQRPDEATHRATEALEFARRHGERGHEAWALRLLGEVVARRDPVDIAHAELNLRHALALAGALTMRPLLAHCHLALSRLYARTANQSQSDEHRDAATTMYREMNMDFYLAQAEAARSEVGDLDPTVRTRDLGRRTETMLVEHRGHRPGRPHRVDRT